MKTPNTLTYINTAVWIAILCTFLMFISADPLLVDDVTELVCDEDTCSCEVRFDALKVAMEIGRLDAVSIALAIFGGAFALSAIFGFLYIKESSRAIAIATATGVATARTEELFEEMSDKKLPRMVASNVAYWMKQHSDVSNETAQRIAEALGDGDSDTPT